MIFPMYLDDFLIIFDYIFFLLNRQICLIWQNFKNCEEKSEAQENLLNERSGKKWKESKQKNLQSQIIT